MRCHETKGAGNSLVCCRHPHDDNAHCWHWSGFMNGVSEPHRRRTRVMGGRLFVCDQGAELDGVNVD